LLQQETRTGFVSPGGETMKRFLIGMVIVGLAFAVPFLVRADDQGIAKSIVQQLQQHKEAGRLRGFGIDLQVDKGNVLLSGEIASLEQMDLVLSAVNETAGVKKVVNELTVKPVAASTATGNPILDGADGVLAAVEKNLTTQLAGTVGTTTPVENGVKGRRPAARVVRSQTTGSGVPAAPEAAKILELPGKALSSIESALGGALGVTNSTRTETSEESGATARAPAARVVRTAPAAGVQSQEPLPITRQPAARVIRATGSGQSSGIPNLLKPAQAALESIDAKLNEALGGDAAGTEKKPAATLQNEKSSDGAGTALEKFDGLVDAALESNPTEAASRAPTSALGDLPTYSPIRQASNEEPLVDKPVAEENTGLFGGINDLLDEVGTAGAEQPAARIIPAITPRPAAIVVTVEPSETAPQATSGGFDPLAGIGRITDGIGAGAAKILNGGAKGSVNGSGTGLLGQLNDSVNELLGFGGEPNSTPTARVVREGATPTVSETIRNQVAGAFTEETVVPVGNEAEITGASDTEIARGISSILGSLKASGRLTNFALHMSVKDGQVTMKGHVPSRNQRDLALIAASKVKGVVGVIHQIDIQLPARQNVATGQPAQFDPGQLPNIAQIPLAAVGIVGAAANQLLPAQQPQGQPAPMMAPAHMASAPSGMQRARYDNPQMPGYAWPTYASYPNYGAVTYPKQYSPNAWPYIGPFYPYPQVPLGWRRVTLEWDDGWWYLDFSSRR